MIEIVTCSGLATIQDIGRTRFRHLGVPVSGALDARLFQIANGLVGNPANAAAIEMRLMGPKLRAHGPVRVALAGDAQGQIENAQGDRRPAPAWSSHALEDGDLLTVGAIRSGVAYLAVLGGLDVPLVLGSRSTYVRARLGGLEGRPLATGDRLPISPLNRSGSVSSAAEAVEMRLPHPPKFENLPVRVLPGPQQDNFTDAAWARFLGSDFLVSPRSDRMGTRLEGERLDHSAKGADIVSDAVTPGAIQVPADGQPILLLADCQTVGGYPKIATVISADIPRLAHFLPGSRIRFVAVTKEEADLARTSELAALQAMLAAIAPVPNGFDLNALYLSNLVSGVIYEKN